MGQEVIYNTGSYQSDSARVGRITWQITGNEVIFSSIDTFLHLGLKDKTMVINKILGPYRNKSIHRQGFYSAALGITTNNRVFISVNTDRQADFKKNCAEVNLVIVKTIEMAQDALKNKFTEIHFMGGKNPSYMATQRGNVQIRGQFCPCGGCVDGLVNESTPDAILYVYPVNSGFNRLKIDYAATDIDNVRPDHIFITRLHSLNAHKHITLSETVAETGRQAFDELGTGGKWVRRFDPRKLVMENHGEELRKLSPYMQKLFDELMVDDGRLKFIQNDFSVSRLNAYMVDRVAEAYQKRPETAQGMHNVGKVRCVVARLSDGSLRSMVEGMGPVDNATPGAEICAVAVADEMCNKISEIWVMEMAPDDIARGIMQTSSKDGLERVFKRRDDGAGGVKTHFIPFNNGQLCDKGVAEIMRDFDIKEVFPSRYSGVVFAERNASRGGITRH